MDAASGKMDAITENHSRKTALINETTRSYIVYLQ